MPRIGFGFGARSCRLLVTGRNARVRYLFGYLWDIPPGNDATNFGLETTDVDRMLGEVNANAPLRPAFGALVAA